MGTGIVVLLAGVLLAGLPAPAASQQAPELMLGARDTTVWLYVPRPPEPNHGFVVYRTGPDGEERRLTETPVRPLEEPGAFAAAVGPERARAMATVDADDALALLRGVQTTPLTSHVMSLLYRGVARGLGRGYLDPDVEPGESYRYRVVYVDADDDETDAVRAGTIDVVARAPQPPAEVGAEAVPHEVVVAWEYPAYTGDPTDIVVSFEVERAEADGSFRRVTRDPVVRNDAAPLRFVDRAVVPGRSYRYRVRAKDMVDRVGPPSEPVTAVTADPRPPRPPPGLETEAGDGEVLLRWRIAPDPRVAGYVVERSMGIDQPYERLNEALVPAMEPTYLDTTAEGTVRYFYRVASADSAGRVGPSSNGIVAAPHDWTPPAPPSAGPQVDVVERQLRIRWTPSPSADVIGYHVYRGDAENRMGRLTETPLEDTTFFDPGFDGDGLRPGQRYVVSVTAVDRAYNESDPALVEAAIPDDEPPAPPTGLVLESHHGRHTVIRWSGSPSLDVDRFVLQRAGPDTAGAVTIGERPVDAPRRLRDTTAVTGATYEYRLVAVDTAGNRSAPAVDTIALVDPSPPPAPRHAAAEATAEGVTIRWERVVDPDLAGYRVYRASIPTGSFTAVSPLIPADGERVYVDPEGEPGHYYTVRAVDTSGSTSRPSPAVSGGAR